MSGYTGRMNQRITIELLLTFEGRLPVVTVLPDTVIRGYMGPPKKVWGKSADDSPRERSYYMLEMPVRTVGVDTIVPTPGSLLSLDGTTYEVIGAPRDLVSNRRTYGFQVPVLPFSVLYPNVGTLGGVGGSDGAGPQIAFSMWPGVQASRDRGAFDDLLGEAPAAAWELLRQTNASLTLDEQVYRVTSALLHLEQPHVALRLKRRDS